MIPKYIESNRDFLHCICNIKSQQKLDKLIKEANDEELLAIVDICYNILRGRLRLKEKDRARLSSNADYYRSISRSRTPNTARHRIQVGGNPALIGAIVAPILGALAQTLLDRALSKE